MNSGPEYVVGIAMAPAAISFVRASDTVAHRRRHRRREREPHRIRITHPEALHDLAFPQVVAQVAPGLEHREPGIGDRARHENVGHRGDPVAHVADLLHPALAAGLDRADPPGIEHREDEVGPRIDLGERDAPGDRGVVLGAGEVGEQPGARIGRRETACERRPGVEPRADAQAGHVPDDIRLRELPGGRAREPRGLLLEHLVEREIGAGEVALDRHEALLRELPGDALHGLARLPALRDHELRVGIGELPQRGLHDFLVGGDAVDVAHRNAELVADAHQAAITGFDEAAVVDASGEHRGDGPVLRGLRSPFRARAERERGSAREQQAAAWGQGDHAPILPAGLGFPAQLPR